MTRWTQLGLSLLIVSGLSSCTPENPDDDPRIRGIIVPHHNLVEEYIDSFYSEIAIEAGDVDRIIVLSPNHFDMGQHYIQSTTTIDTDLKFDEAFIETLTELGAVGVESISFGSEHGLMVHIRYLETYFPNAEVVPIILKWKVPKENLDKLIDAILAEDDLEDTLVIASIDFSHFVSEETAMANDARTMAWLEEWGAGAIDPITLDMIWELEHSTAMDTETATGMDSPENFYVLTQLMGTPNQVDIWARTSSISLFGGENPLQNTSHLFVKVW